MDEASSTETTTDDASTNEPVEQPDTESNEESVSGAGHEVDAEIFNLDSTFEDLGIRNSVMKALKEMDFKHPTCIQYELIPRILENKDVLGQAKTGTGKTAAFGLPILQLADRDTPMQALILAPVRELASQIMVELEKFGKYTPIRAVNVVGGEKMKKQINRLKDGAQIIVGTPGRVIDLLDRGVIKLENIKWVVLDEVDRMLDIGFRDDIRNILKRIKHPHQTSFVSATISDEIERLGRRFMREDAEKISTVSASLTVSQVDQKHLPVAGWDKMRLLAHLLKHEHFDLTIVFCRMKVTVREVAEYLQEQGLDAREMHGDMHQSWRNKVMKKLRSGTVDVLVASDLAARGLDVEGVSHIINYDLPPDPEVYIHRIGRTARAGRRGTAWSFVLPREGKLLMEIEKLSGVMIDRLEYPDFEASEKPEGWTDPDPNAPPDFVHELEPPKPRSETPLHGPVDEKKGVDASMFPSGIVPKSMPKKRLGSKFRTGRRGM